MEAVVVADLLAEGVAGRHANPLDCVTSLNDLVLRKLLSGLGCAVCSSRLVGAGRVILRRRQVHLVLVGAARLDHTWWFAHDLLVRHRR